jgi:hypothetical protein
MSEYIINFKPKYSETKEVIAKCSFKNNEVTFTFLSKDQVIDDKILDLRDRATLFDLIHSPELFIKEFENELS